jgi:hypothetical protein
MSSITVITVYFKQLLGYPPTAWTLSIEGLAGACPHPPHPPEKFLLAKVFINIFENCHKELESTFSILIFYPHHLSPLLTFLFIFFNFFPR